LIRTTFNSKGYWRSLPRHGGELSLRKLRSFRGLIINFRFGFYPRPPGWPVGRELR
jgi:hypothetical protein